MFAKLKNQISKGPQTVAMGLSVVGLLVGATILGVFEPLELHLLDRFSRLRASKGVVDSRFLIVTINESDISNVGQWPVSDETLAQVIQNISMYEPTVVGLDIYRNLSVEPGSAQLKKVFQDTPYLIGVEKVGGVPVAPHKTLDALEQSAAADLLVDPDGRVRRGLLTLRSVDGELKSTLSTALALEYLARENIFPEMLDEQGLLMGVGKAKIRRFERSDGGYVNADHYGYQVLMNYRTDYRQFESISMTAVLNGALREEKVRDRIVLLGSTAVSLNDLFYTPLEKRNQVAGVYIHAHLTSQLLSAALDGKPFLKTVPNYVEWLWACFWMLTSVLFCRSILYSNAIKSEAPIWHLLVRMMVLCGGLLASNYGLFLAGWWLPVVLPIAAVLSTTALGVSYRNAQLQNLAAFDELTQVANRRHFDQSLASALKARKQLSLLLCDVDYFKAFNDLYGHQAGDLCLHRVAQALKRAVRSEDLVARYGGEEFVVVLMNAEEDKVVAVAERIKECIGSLEIVHEGSKVNPFVTLSCGLASVAYSGSVSAHELIEYADKALYEAKQSGRNRLVVSRWQINPTEKLLGEALPETEEAA